MLPSHHLYITGMNFFHVSLNKNTNSKPSITTRSERRECITQVITFQAQSQLLTPDDLLCLWSGQTLKLKVTFLPLRCITLTLKTHFFGLAHCWFICCLFVFLFVSLTLVVLLIVLLIVRRMLCFEKWISIKLLLWFDTKKDLNVKFLKKLNHLLEDNEA